MGIVSKVKNSKTQFLLVGVLAVGLIFGVLSLTYAAETPLHDEAPGTVITFSGKEWIILEQMPNGETYILLKDPDYRRAFDPDDTNRFNPSDQNNIAYYLNTTFYQSLSQKALISDHSWDRVSNDSTDYGNVTCKIGLISFREYQKYSSFYNGDMLLHSYSYSWWTRTSHTEYSWGVCFVTPSGFLSRYSASYSDVAVRPALYLKPGTLIDENKEVTYGRPDTPTNLSASSQSPNAVNLTWQAVNGVAGYRIYRDDNMIAETVSTTYTDDTVLPGMTYSYSISAYNTDDLESKRSAPVTVTTPPATPTGLCGSAAGRTVTLTWEGPGNPRYIVQRSVNGIDYTQVGEVTEESFTETNDLWGTTYYYRVAQKGQDGAVSAYSEAVQVATEPVPTPTGLSAVLDGNNINLSWQAVEGVNTYIVERSTGGELWEEIANVTAPTYTDTVTDPDIEYLYRVRADGGNQVSAPSNIVGSTLSNPEPVAPRLSYSVDNMNIRVSWNIQDVSGYRVYINDELKDELPGNVRDYSFAGDTGLTYKIKVEAFNPYGTASSTLTVKVGSFTTPGAAKMVGDIATNAGAVLGSMGGLLALALAFKGAGPLIDAARKVIGL